MKQRYERLISAERYPIYIVDADKNEEEILAKALEYINQCKGEKTYERVEY